MSNSFKLCPTYLPSGEKFLGGFALPATLVYHHALPFMTKQRS